MTKILIVDEDTDVLRLLRIKLGSAGHEVSRARDGQEALALAAEVRPDVAIMERLLPDMDGVELIGHLRSIEGTPPLILVLSGNVSEDEIGSAFAAGADDYVAKPFSPQLLLERIRTILIRRSVAAPNVPAADGAQ